MLNFEEEMFWRKHQEEMDRMKREEKPDFGLADITLKGPDGEEIKFETTDLKDYITENGNEIAQLTVDHDAGIMDIQFFNRPEKVTVNMTPEQTKKMNEEFEKAEKVLVLQPQYAKPEWARPDATVPIKWDPDVWEVVRYNEREGVLDLKRKGGPE